MEFNETDYFKVTNMITLEDVYYPKLHYIERLCIGEMQ